MAPYIKSKPVLWQIVKSQGTTFLQRKTLMLDTGNAAALQAELNRKEREICKLRNELDEMYART